VEGTGQSDPFMIRKGDQMMTKRESVAVSSLRSGQDARQDKRGLELSLLAREGDASGSGKTTGRGSVRSHNNSLYPAKRNF
jgi:hypothetical protein